MRSILIQTLLVISMMVTSANAQGSSRADSWEFFLVPKISSGKTIDFGHGAKAELDERFSLGLGFGYNLDTHHELTLLFSSSSSNYTGTSVAADGTGSSETFGANMYTSSFDLGYTYNFFDGPFTPYVSANLGTTYIDSGISTGDEHIGCWWHPWYGQICSTVDPTYTSVRLNYGASIGVRYDLKNKLFFKGNIGKNYVDIGDDPGFTIYQLFFGSTF